MYPQGRQALGVDAHHRAEPGKPWTTTTAGNGAAAVAGVDPSVEGTNILAGISRPRGLVDKRPLAFRQAKGPRPEAGSPGSAIATGPGFNSQQKVNGWS